MGKELEELTSMAVVKQKQSHQPIRAKENITRSQWEVKKKTSNQAEAGENRGCQVVAILVFHLIGWETFPEGFSTIYSASFYSNLWAY